MLTSERYIMDKLRVWSSMEKQEFLQAYNKGDWNIVDKMTADLDGSAHFQWMVLSGLAADIKNGD